MSRIEKALRKAIEEQQVSRRGERPRASGDVAQAGADIQAPAAISGIQSMPPPPSVLGADARAAMKIISPELQQSSIVKAFRELRTKIGQQVAADAVILVTGVAKDSGSSFVATNLAAAVAFDSMRTALLVDCNLRDPAQNRLLQSDAALGLVDYLENEQLGVSDIIHATGIERLRVIPVGTKVNERAEYFTLERMRRLIADLAARYPDRQIIVDAPPLTASADTQILAGLCHHVLLVVPYGRLSESGLQAALKTIDASKLLGVVLNDEPVLPALPWRERALAWLKALLRRFPGRSYMADKAGR